MSILSITALSAALLFQAPSNESFMVVRAGDGEMSCAALASAVNDLSAQQRQQQQRAETARNAGRVGRGLLSGLARGANMFGYGSSEGAAAAVAVTAAAAAAEQMSASGTDTPGRAPAVTAEQQRLAHLTALIASRGC